MTCQYANACEPGHGLPMTGLEMWVIVIFAVLCICIGLAVRWSQHGVDE